eukprot:INCI9191.1.p1 GENE.INCI9191.1~~INCI9191.1.p1  ORF type:complete len:923 (-),score=231.80 INCI9191.1:52-2820(-)
MTEALPINGKFDVPTQSLLREFLNDNWDAASFRPKKLSGSKFNSAHVKALQTFLNSQRLGPVHPINGEPTAEMIKLLRKFLNKNWDKAGFRSKKLSLTGDMSGGFAGNSGTVKALQYFLNTHNGLAPADASSGSASGNDSGNGAQKLKAAADKAAVSIENQAEKAAPAPAPAPAAAAAAAAPAPAPEKTSDATASSKDSKPAAKPADTSSSDGGTQTPKEAAKSGSNKETAPKVDEAAAKADCKAEAGDENDTNGTPTDDGKTESAADAGSDANNSTAKSPSCGRPKSLKRGGAGAGKKKTKKAGGKIGGLLAKMGGSIMMPGMKPPPSLASKLAPSGDGGGGPASGARTADEVEASTKAAVTSRPAQTQKRKPSTRKKFAFGIGGSASTGAGRFPVAGGQATKNKDSSVSETDPETHAIQTSNGESQGGASQSTEDESSAPAPTDIPGEKNNDDKSLESNSTPSTLVSTGAQDATSATASDKAQEVDGKDEASSNGGTKKKKGVLRRKSGPKKRGSKIGKLAAGLGGIKLGMPGMTNPYSARSEEDGGSSSNDGGAAKLDAARVEAATKAAVTSRPAVATTKRRPPARRKKFTFASPQPASTTKAVKDGNADGGSRNADDEAGEERSREKDTVGGDASASSAKAVDSSAGAGAKAPTNKQSAIATAVAAQQKAMKESKMQAKKTTSTATRKERVLVDDDNSDETDQNTRAAAATRVQRLVRRRSSEALLENKATCTVSKDAAPSKPSEPSKGESKTASSNSVPESKSNLSHNSTPRKNTARAPGGPTGPPPASLKKPTPANVTATANTPTKAGTDDEPALPSYDVTTADILAEAAGDSAKSQSAPAAVENEGTSSTSSTPPRNELSNEQPKGIIGRTISLGVLAPEHGSPDNGNNEDGSGFVDLDDLDEEDDDAAGDAADM